MKRLKAFTGIKQLRIIGLNYDLIKWLDSDVGSDANGSDEGEASEEEEGATHSGHQEGENNHEKNVLSEVSAIPRHRWVEHCIKYFTKFFTEQAANNPGQCAPEISIVLEP
jgi:hypothetical protein